MSMTLMSRRDPFADFDTIVRRAFPARPGFTGRATATNAVAATAGFTPAAEIVRDGDDALVKLELPGVDFASDISVELDGTTLTISGERRDERTEDGEGRLFTEIRYGSFRRSFTLPEQVTADALSASYDAGVLTVRVSGAYVGTQPAKISVTAGKQAPSVDAVTEGAHDGNDAAQG